MKKNLCIITLITVFMFILSSCSKISNDPIELARTLDENDYAVEILIDNEEIEYLADEFEIKTKGIHCIIVAFPDDGEYEEEMGIAIYCEKTNIAEDLADDLNDYVDDNDDFKDNVKRGIVERAGKIVFIGCEDTWEDMQ